MIDPKTSLFRNDFLYNEYIEGIRLQLTDAKLAGRRFRNLNWGEITSAFYAKKLMVRSHLRMVSIAILCEYITVSLEGHIVNIVEAISDAYGNRADWLRKQEPLIYLLIKLYKNGEELNIGEGEQEELFEQFFILERGWRYEGKFFSLLKFLFEQSQHDFDDYSRLLTQQLANRSFWQPAVPRTNVQEDLKDADQIFLRILALLEFLFELKDFLDQVENKFIRSACWNYFRTFLACIEQVRFRLVKIMETFATAMAGRSVEPVQSENQDAPVDKIKIQYTMDSIKAIISQLTGRNYNHLNQYLMNEAEPLFVYAGTIDFQEEGFDITQLRNLMQNRDGLTNMQ